MIDCVVVLVLLGTNIVDTFKVLVCGCFYNLLHVFDTNVNITSASLVIERNAKSFVCMS
jgi:hypothetical protein